MSTETSAATFVAQMKELHGRGLYLQAYEVAKQLGPFENWTDVDQLLIGGRLAHNLGSSRLGRVMHRRAYATEPTHPLVQYFYVLSMSQRRSSLQTWELMESIGRDLPGGDDTLQADWYTLRACTLAILRDFEQSDHWYNEAEQLCPDRAWLHVCRTFLLEQQDQPDAALESAQHALTLRPWYRPAVQSLADRFVQLNRDDEALQLLREGCTRLESGDVQCQLGALLLETQQYEEARTIYENVDKLYPLMHRDRKRPEWLAARRADAAYYCGDFAAASEHAVKADVPFYTELADRLSNEDREGKRKILPVKFVRQNRLTCAPATLSAICDYWGKPVEHLEVVDMICFDGTPAHSERRWAENEGYVVREFRLTWETAIELIKREIPFTLATVDSGSGHLQAVIGYDSYRQSLIIRDPGERHFHEFQTKKMLEHYAACGPRGMAMVPQDKAHLLDGIEFVDAELHNLGYQVDLALEAHDRNQAASIVADMTEKSPSDRLTLRSRGSLASYDADVNELLSVANALLEQFPDDVNFLATKLSCLNELGRRDDRVDLLTAQITKPTCDPMFWLRYAGELIDDARQQEHVTYYLRRAARFRPHDSSSYQMLAGLAMDQQRHDDALELYRFAACIDDMKETAPRSYFLAARMQNQSDKAMHFVQERFNRFGKKSGSPVRTLCWALEQIDRNAEAMKVLDEGCELRKDDGDLMLYAADVYGRYGKMDKAAELLNRAQGSCHRTDWLRASALQDRYRGQLDESLKKWLQVIEADPLDANAHRCATELLADTQGVEAAIAHIDKFVEQFPHSYSMRMLLIEWLRQESPERFKSELQEFLRLHPGDAWAMREMAFHALQERDFDEATDLINRSNEIEPRHPAAEFVLGRAAEARNDKAAAKEHYRNTARISIDYEFAILGLMSCCDEKTEREQELEFVYDELKRQVNNGDGLLTYCSYASQTLDSATMKQRLQEALEARPDLWAAWSATIRHLSETQQHEEAIKLATEASQRFPLLPRIWLDRAAAHAVYGDIEGEIESLRKAKEINQNWGEPARMLSEAFEKKGDLDAARVEIERVIVAEPRDPRNHGFLASLMWRQDEQQAAVDRMVNVLQRHPEYETGWNMLRAWSAQLKQHEKVIEVTKQLTEKRPKSVRAWMLYAESLGEREQIDEAVAALDEAIKINPTSVEVYSQKAFQLTRAGKFDEAIAAAQPSTFGDSLPIELKARVAWVEGERGNQDTAIKAMEKVVKQDPDYFWAWHRLAEWYELTEQGDKYHQASEEMTRLEPHNAISWGYLGQAELGLNRPKIAKKHFLQAVQLSPAYSFASTQLIDMQLADKEYDEAAQTIDIIAPHIGPAWVLSEKPASNRSAATSRRPSRN